MLLSGDIYSKAFRKHWESSLLQAHLCIAHREDVYVLLSRAYSESQRYYHTHQHIVECLTHFHQIQHLLYDPLAVEIAIWFHDVVYDPKALDNELQSAALMKQVCLGFLSKERLEKVYEWILATQKHQASEDVDLNYVLDIDLAILGSKSDRFTAYERQIQLEYAWVETNIYHMKRHAVLEHFFAIQPLFQTVYFQENLENQAKQNLKSILKQPRLD